MATFSSILAWKIPWTEEPGSLIWTVSLSLIQDYSFFFFKIILIIITKKAEH